MQRSIRTPATRWKKPVLGGLGAMLALAFGAGHAQQPPQTREEIRSEAASAAKARQLDTGEVTRVPQAASTRPRAEVKAETRPAVKAGTVGHGEVAGPPASSASVKTRAEVKAEAASAIRPHPAASKADAADAKK